ncbi:Zn-ribbon domain-containing OB-fold protein [Dactylosporangium sp. NPDC000555]|uniref:Zn-ribbon domain-containing OB-fold protein n=1 Tax=Dactylosporangium sp. NPDC000555 TaxID=3154260 RepID=UPI00332EB342
MSTTTAADPVGEIPLPVPSPRTQPFWTAAAGGTLVLQRCPNDASYQWTPQQACIECLSEDLVWEPVSGRGTVYSYSIVRRPQTPAFGVPYVVVIIELEEGPRMLSRLVDVDPESVTIGMPVQVSFERHGDLALPLFTRAEQGTTA